MKMRFLIAVTITAALLSACLPSVNPFYTEKDVVFDSDLLGEWQIEGETKPSGIWKIEKTDGKAYKLTTTEPDGKQGEFAVHLFKLEKDCFLDLIPSDCTYGAKQTHNVATAMFPGHLLMRVTLRASQLKVAPTDFGWLEKHLTANPKALAHHVEDKRLLLTADTRALQRFVLKHLGDGELFEKPTVMVRK